MKDLRGNLRQKSKNGTYYYRLTVANGIRKEFALKTSDYEEVCQKASDLDAVWEAPTQEVAIAQLNAIKGFSKQAQNLPFNEVWQQYEVHPNRAHASYILSANRPHTEFRYGRISGRGKIICLDLKNQAGTLNVLLHKQKETCHD